jgi:U3 small nucleolar RNA-associated protein 19
MGKRESGSHTKGSNKKRKSIEDPLSKECISSQTREILGNIESVDVSSLTKLIGLFDNFLEQFESEEGLSKYENTARFLNLQLFKIFESLFSLKKLTPAKEDPSNFKKLKQAYELYKFNLLFFLENVPLDCSLIVDNLDIYMKLLKFESSQFASTSKDGTVSRYFPTKSYKDLLTALLKSHNGDILPDGTNSNIVIQEFISCYYQKYYDLQFYFVSELSIEDVKELENQDSFSKFLTIMKGKTIISEPFEDSKTFLNNLPSIVSNQHQYKTNFEAKWLHFLGKELSIDQYKTTILILHKRIIPYFKKPTNLMDFLTDSYEVGGIISILALNGLFELIKNYNLDYPNFYTKLFTLLDYNLLHVKYRSRFFRLTDLFLSSTHLPAALVASFIKKLARLSIVSSPSAVVTVIPFIYNLLKRHPTCMILLQNVNTSENYTDPYDDTEKDPLKTNAIESSLWEMETLASHYHPNVATLAKIFSQPFRKQSYNMEDFLDWSYNTLLESENTRRLKTEVALEYDTFESALGDYVKEWRW